MSDDTLTDPTPDGPDWLVPEPFTDTDLGPLKSGKEAQIDLIERTGLDGRGVLLAVKRYVPRSVSTKGELEALGFDRASAFRHDVQYREGRQFRKTRDRRAVERMTAHGRRLLQARWTDHEFTVMTALWRANVAVPYPVSFAEDRFVLQYLGDRARAAPQLASARLDPDQLASAADQLVAGLHQLVAAGWIHGDLSPYNLLWWDETLWFIDFPQAVDLAANPQGLNLLHRDVTNVASWFNRKGQPIDAEEVFAELLAATW
ncbi:MAG: RIO1 family regulatory kinase/ATPase [Actinomycetota bacterium]